MASFGQTGSKLGNHGFRATPGSAVDGKQNLWQSNPPLEEYFQGVYSLT
jgi:hypothetical protein